MSEAALVADVTPVDPLVHLAGTVAGAEWLGAHHPALARAVRVVVAKQVDEHRIELMRRQHG